MKKFTISLLTSFALVAGLSSCGGDSTTTKDTPVDTPQTEKPTAPVAPVDTTPAETPVVDSTHTPADTTQAEVTKPKPSSSLSLSRNYRSTRTFNSSSGFNSSKFSTTPTQAK